MAKWIKTNFPGIRYREHPTRKNGVRRDQYFTIRYKLAGKDREEGLGWASENWTAAKAYERLKELKENRKAGEGPQTLAEKRDLEDKRKEAEKTEQELAEKESVTFGQYFEKVYFPTFETGRKKTLTIAEIKAEPDPGLRILMKVQYIIEHGSAEDKKRAEDVLRAATA